MGIFDKIFKKGNTAEYRKPARASGRFTDQGNGTVTDNITGLTWQKEDDGICRSYKDAIDYCRKLKLADLTGWRLPTLDELASIVSKGSPTNADPIFTGNKKDIYWTVTELNHILDGENLGKTVAYTIDFLSGEDITYNKENGYFVRAVR